MKDTLPAWATVLIALGASILGGGFGAWLQTRHESKQQMRERMIAAADEVSARLIQALLPITHIDAARLEVDDGQRLDIIRECRRRQEEGLARMGRIELLFGQRDVAAAGYEALGEIRLASDELEEARPVTAESCEAVARHVEKAAERLGEFNRLARASIQGTRARSHTADGAGDDDGVRASDGS